MGCSRQQLETVAKVKCVGLEANWSGLDAVWPLVELIKADGSVVVIKVDGERRGPFDNGPYTALVSGRPLGQEPIRIDSHSLEEAMIFVIVIYARRVWGIAQVR